MPAIEAPAVSRNWRILRRLIFIFIGLLTLLALLWIEENIRGKNAWLKYKAELEAKGEKLDFQEFIPLKVPDDQNFAMTPLLAPLFDFVPASEHTPEHLRDTNAQDRAMLLAPGQVDGWKKYPVSESRFWTRGEPMDLNEYVAALTNPSNVPTMSKTDAAAELLKQFKQFQPQMDELLAASHRPYCRFNIEYHTNDPPGILLFHLSVLRRLGLLFNARAGAELQLGQGDAAATDIKMLLFLGDCIAREPFLISHMVRIALGQLALEPLWIGLAEHKWSDAQLADFQHYLAKQDFLEGCQYTMRGELAMDVGTIESMRNGTLTPAVLLAQGNDSPLFKLVPSGMYYQNAVHVARLFEEYALPALDPANHRLRLDKVSSNAKVDSMLGSGFKPYKVFAILLFPNLGNITLKTAAAQVRIDEAIVACALERHRLAKGDYPESLDALKPQFTEKIPNDVITGAPLIYRRDSKGGFLLYSLGWNNKDDGGKIATVGNGKSDKIDLTQGDWVWPEYPAK